MNYKVAEYNQFLQLAVRMPPPVVEDWWRDQRVSADQSVRSLHLSQLSRVHPGRRHNHCRENTPLLCSEDTAQSSKETLIFHVKWL